jgi:hypothetical protein
MILVTSGRGQLKRDGTRTETIYRLSAKRTSSFKSAEASVQATTGSRGVSIGGSNAGYTMFRSSVKGTSYPRHSPVSPSILLPCVTVRHHISTGVYLPNTAHHLEARDSKFVRNVRTYITKCTASYTTIQSSRRNCVSFIITYSMEQSPS